MLSELKNSRAPLVGERLQVVSDPRYVGTPPLRGLKCFQSLDRSDGCAVTIPAGAVLDFPSGIRIKQYLEGRGLWVLAWERGVSMLFVTDLLDATKAYLVPVTGPYRALSLNFVEVGTVAAYVSLRE